MAEQFNSQQVNNIFQSIVDEFKIIFDKKMEPIVEQINLHSNNYQIISSILKQMPEFKTLVSENEHLKKIEEEYKQLKNITNGIVLEVKEDNTYSENNISKLYSELDLGTVTNITQFNYSNLVAEAEAQAQAEIDEEEDSECETEATEYQTEEEEEEEEKEEEAGEDEEEEEEACETDQEEEAEEACETDQEEEAEEACETDQEEEAASEVAEEEEEEEAPEEANEVEEEEAPEEANEVEASCETAEEEAPEEANEVEACETAEEAEEEEACETAEEEAASEADQEEDKPIHERNAGIANEVAQSANEVESEAQASAAEEEEFFMIEIEGYGNFYTNDENNGEIYEITENDELGNKVGDFENGDVIML